MGLEVNRVKYKQEWPKVRLKEVCDRISDGTHFTPEYINEGVAFISVKDIYDGRVHFDKCKYISKQAHNELIKRCYPEKDDILITKSGTIGRMAIVPQKPAFSLFVSVALIKNKKEIIGSIFLKYILENFLNSINIAQDIKGGLLKNFHLEDIRETVIPVVSLEEQHAIVSKIEELFSELDKGKQQLETAQQQLKIYRQAVLKWGFEGKLTNENVKEGELPKGWRIFKLGDITINFDGKRIPLSRDVRATRKGEYRYYGATEVVDHIDDYIFDGVYLLIGEDGANLLTKSRQLAFIAEGKFWVNNHAHVLQAKENLVLKYLLNYFNSINLGQYVTGSAQPKLTQANLNKIPVPIPTIEEQQLIVQEIETRLSVCDKVEETITTSLAQAETLRQSILKKAFEGRLT